jgi:hypothetical protein
VPFTSDVSRLAWGTLRSLLRGLLIVPLAAQTIPFTYAFGSAPVLCTPAVQTHCLDHFEVSWVPQAVIPPGTNPLVIAIPGGATGTMPFTAALAGLLPWGSYTVSVVIVGKDAAGNRVTSDPTKAQVQVNVPLAAPVVGTPTASAFGSGCAPDPLTPDSTAPNGDCWWDCLKPGYVTCGWGSFAVTGVNPGEIPKRS